MSDPRFRAISIHQPWSWGIIHGPKRVENRTWRTRHRGPLLIHASKRRGLRSDLLPGCPYDRLVYGALIGIVTVTECLPIAAVDDPFATGPWCWMLSSPRAITPIPYRGRQGLFWVSLLDV